MDRAAGRVFATDGQRQDGGGTGVGTVGWGDGGGWMACFAGRAGEVEGGAEKFMSGRFERTNRIPTLRV